MRRSHRRGRHALVPGAELPAGRSAAQWARLLDEIAAAKKCLHDPRQRAEYDQRLQEDRGAGRRSRPPSRTAVEGRRLPEPAAPEAKPAGPGTVPMSAPQAVPMSAPGAVPMPAHGGVPMSLPPTATPGPMAGSPPPAGQPQMLPPMPGVPGPGGLLLPGLRTGRRLSIRRLPDTRGRRYLG